MTEVNWQGFLVFVTVSLASLYLARKLLGPVGRRKKRDRKPDVPVSALLRKQRDRGGAGKNP